MRSPQRHGEHGGKAFSSAETGRQTKSVSPIGQSALLCWEAQVSLACRRLPIGKKQGILGGLYVSVVRECDLECASLIMRSCSEFADV